jgi:Flp pilus assembly pilin Flp
MKRLRAFLADTSATNAIQYAFIAAGIAASIIVGVNTTSISFRDMWIVVAKAIW